MNIDEFIQLATALREHGATRVEANGFVAVFPIKDAPKLFVPTQPDKSPPAKPLNDYQQLEADLAKDFS